ncbi:Bax inhibitor-1 family protein [Helicobacter mehlei]|uniref:Bax inhibitor-1/YccA family protein n=1 Tax=Helicobacter mehlei TaxID=2316080 RepID=A0A553V2J5_9HELI|nr:Bax inhibitor-1/YccA family protein [Helicobacter mehlei]TSA86652.1 Bax inhibitor-1/YccA family protein [Helicobacter mehlei]
MALYDRSGLQQEAFSHAQQSETALVNFVKTTYKFFAASLLLATIGALIGFMNFHIALQYKWVFFIAEIVAFFGLMFTRSMPTLNMFMLFAFTFLSGITLVPLLGFVIAKSGAAAIWQALGMTTIVFGVMSVYAIKTKNDLANMGKMLFIAVIVVLVASLINLFLNSPFMQVAIAGVSVILFSLFVAYDTQNIIRGLYESPIQAATALYIDFLNIFVSLLQIMGIMGGRND